jgi:DNA (cytosine-5)-methyltransferase 1
MRFLSVCSGIEAASVAWKPLGWKAAAFAEIEPFPCSVLAHHYPDVPNLGDMTRFQEWPDLGPTDLVCGGTPCQAFSVAGLRQGLADPRGNLALTFLAIVDRYRPQWVVWENVPGVLSSNGGQDFGAFLGGLGHLGYGWCYRVVDAQYVRVDGYNRAVPQRRRRVFVVGYLGDWRRAAAVLSEPQGVLGDTPPSRRAGQGSAAGAALSVALRGREGGGTAELGDDCGLTLRASTSGGDKPHVLQAFGETAPCLTGGYGEQAGQDFAKDGGLVPVGFDWYASQSQSMPVLEGCSPLLKTTMQPAVAQGWSVRRLTPTECERLQGFPDGYTAIPHRGKPAADGPRYKALGNSWAVNAARWIGRRIELVEEVASEIAVAEAAE